MKPDPNCTGFFPAIRLGVDSTRLSEKGDLAAGFDHSLTHSFRGLKYRMSVYDYAARPIERVIKSQLSSIYC